MLELAFVAFLHGLQQTLQLPLEVTLHLQRASEDLKRELAIIVEKLIIRFGLLEPLRFTELVLVGSRSRCAASEQTRRNEK